MSVTAGVSDTALTVRDKLTGKIGQTKVKRYWPGKAPDWAEEVDEDGDIRMAARSEEAVVERVFAHQDGGGGTISDPRIRRLAESRVDDPKEAIEDHQRIRKAEIVSTAAEEMQESAEAEDEEAVDARRRRIKEKKLLEREREREEMELQGIAEEEESEYETDSEEEEVIGVAMLKPVFVAKAGRDTVAERERIEEEERVEERKVETKQILVEEIKKEEMVQKNVEMEAEIADDDNDNGAEDYEAWKVREIGRIKRGREAPDAMVKAREEVERREWERKNTKPAKQKWRFMQKYYHKGAFFQDQGDDRAATAGTYEIYRRDFSAPTGEDRMDKSILPKVMQVKNFGVSGRPKWSHLLNEDTTDWTNPWTFNDLLRAKYNAKMAGMNTTIERHKGRKKLKVC